MFIKVYDVNDQKYHLVNVDKISYITDDTSHVKDIRSIRLTNEHEKVVLCNS